ncbi:MAG TPA: hypothetical protein ENN85_06770 [Methanoculleus sp.]|nr:hypothetical protein [Methanoculleus sp.]
MTFSPTPFPDGPDPGFEGAAFLGWLKKRSGMRDVSHCEVKCKENGFTAKEFINRVGEDYVRLGRRPGGGKVIKLEKKVWADQWMSYYDLEVPHHRHWKRL